MIVVSKNYSKDSQRNGTNHGTYIIYRTVVSTGLQLSTSISSRNEHFSLYFLYERSHAIGLCHGHWSILVDTLGHFNKTVEQNNKFRAFEKITSKNEFLLLLHKFFKRCIHTLSVVFFLWDFNF